MSLPPSLPLELHDGHLLMLSRCPAVNPKAHITVPGMQVQLGSGEQCTQAHERYVCASAGSSTPYSLLACRLSLALVSSARRLTNAMRLQCSPSCSLRHHRSVHIRMIFMLGALPAEHCLHAGLHACADHTGNDCMLTGLPPGCQQCYASRSVMQSCVRARAHVP